MSFPNQVGTPDSLGRINLHISVDPDGSVDDSVGVSVVDTDGNRMTNYEGNLQEVGDLVVQEATSWDELMLKAREEIANQLGLKSRRDNA